MGSAPAHESKVDRVAIKRVLVSVFDKAGVVEFCRLLADKGCELLSTGGTAKALRDAGLSVKDVSEHTGFPEMMDGRVKTLHPKVHGGLLALRDNDEHMGKAEEHHIGMIDMVICNLYPFEATIARPGVTRAEAIEQIDIGGPSMVRSAAKNHAFVAVVTDPADYSKLSDELREHGALSLATRRSLAVKAFQSTASYDGAISSWLATQESPDDMPEVIVTRYRKAQGLRYGENPHQQAAFYEDLGWSGSSLARATQHSGKELSYNNLLDLDAALRLAREFSEPAAVVVKHTNPCGCAVGATVADAFQRAYEGDPLSAFGGIVALNRECDEATAKRMVEGDTFLEAVIAPSFSAEALEVITVKSDKKWRKAVRLLSVGELKADACPPDLRTVTGGVLVQSRDTDTVADSDLSVPTITQPTADQLAELKFAWRVVKHIKSNAICITSGRQLVGLGAGQVSRVDSTEMAILKAGKRAQGAVLASDAFFPFPDSIEKAKAAGITAIIQPGGSVRDADVIKACDEAGIAMVFTGMRHFRH